MPSGIYSTNLFVQGPIFGRELQYLGKMQPAKFEASSLSSDIHKPIEQVYDFDTGGDSALVLRSDFELVNYSHFHELS